MRTLNAVEQKERIQAFKNLLPELPEKDLKILTEDLLKRGVNVIRHSDGHRRKSPFYNQYNSTEIGKKAFAVVSLSKGAIPIYDKV